MNLIWKRKIKVKRFRAIIDEWGSFEFEFSTNGLSRLSFLGVQRKDVVSVVSDEVRLIYDWLVYYFDRGIWKFPNFPIDLSWATPFQKRVYESVMKIPMGVVKTYGDVAEVLGDRRKARAVGLALAKNRIPLVVPCHRVVASSSIGGFTWGKMWKARLLLHERAVLSRGLQNEIHALL